MEKTIAFLKSLSKNNNREWFEKNKPKFLIAKEEFELFVTALVNEVTKFDGSLMGLDPKKFIFRIYRDVRFSKDKRPYKTNFGAGISSNGKGLGRPGYYLHVEPGGKSFVAGGLYMPEPEILGKVRQEIDYSGDELRKIMSNKKFKNLYRDFWDEDKLKTMPKGYPKDHRYIDWLKLKSFIVTHELSDTKVLDKKFVKTASDAFKTLKPLNDFLKQAIE
ncbi:MAG TPA: DUF2461 domain-containing protein [Cyclobacteriaceae bacterium]|nr:DUF2461 domain-containing protein [Cyclobacteriaceae bacterium]